MANIKLIVGLGNPGAEYANTRHNVGAWFVEQLATQHRTALRFENKFHGLFASLSLNQEKCLLLIPSTYMNESGRAVAAVMQFYKISAPEVLVAHDELDFPVGQLRLKANGGHGGHNGLRDILQVLGSDQFMRLRIGISHPGHKDKVSPYVLSKPSQHDENIIRQALDAAANCLDDLVKGDLAKAMRYLHQ